MKLTIDNLQGLGAADYTAALDATVAPQIEWKLNRPSGLRLSLMANSAGFVMPVSGARIMLAKGNGDLLFTGYLTKAPQAEYLGWGERGAVYRHEVVAESDEVLLDQKALPNRAPFVGRTAGSALLKQMPPARVLHGDKGYDSNAIRRQVEENGTMPNIPPKANRRWKNCFSPVLYRDRNAIERMFCRLKDFRRVATRYDRNAVNFLAAVCIAATVSYWL